MFIAARILLDLVSLLFSFGCHGNGKTLHVFTLIKFIYIAACESNSIAYIILCNDNDFSPLLGTISLLVCWAVFIVLS